MLLDVVWNNNPMSSLRIGTPRSSAAIFRLVCKKNSDYQVRRVVSCHVCPPARSSVGMEHGFHSTDFHEIWYEYFRKSVGKIKLSLKPDKNNGHIT
jgi:hypothetical protein